MIYKYSILRKILRLCILISLTVTILSACGQKGELGCDIKLSVLPDTRFLRTSINQVNSSMQGTIEENKKRNMPEIEVSKSGDSSFLKVKIHNEKEYRIFVECLEDYTECCGITLNLEETDTVIYLDDILAYQNFKFITINYGGTISARNMEVLSESLVKDIELHHPYTIEENVLSQMPALQYITIRIDGQYNGAVPAKELLQNTNCVSIVVIWDDEGKEEVNLEELTEWGEINITLHKDDCYLKALYVSNEDDYNYISYEFCVRGEETANSCETNACAVFICIKDRESYGEKYFDIIEVPIESIDRLSWLDGIRVNLADVNFDGYRDLIFMGSNEILGEPHRCIGFLWNEKEQRYEWNATVPQHYRWIDDERKRITDIYPSSLLDEYFIYEYHDGIFTEKKLEVISSLTDYYLLIWQYYEDGELMKRLERNFDEETKLYYITYEENGIVTEIVMEEPDYDNKYHSYSDLGKEYFPEFDFYWAG